jgi:hypothetical protein
MKSDMRDRAYLGWLRLQVSVLADLHSNLPRAGFLSGDLFPEKIPSLVKLGFRRFLSRGGSFIPTGLVLV